MVLAVLGSWIQAWPLIQQGVSTDVLAPSVSQPRRFIQNPSIAELGRNSRAVTALDDGAGALKPRQPSN